MDPNETISTSAVKKLLSGSNDIVFNTISINSNPGLCFDVVFVDGMVKGAMIDDYVLKPLIQEKILSSVKTEEDLIRLIMQGTVYHGVRKLREKLEDCLGDLLSGSVILIFDRSQKAVTFEVKGFEKRSIQEPTSENVAKGSKEAFIEVLRVNTGIIRRRIQTPDLVISESVIGKRTRTTIAIVYLRGVANQNIVKQVKERLENINVDGAVTTEEIESALLDKPRSFFPQLLYTERVDKFCGNILEGRVGIVIDGLPLLFIVPVDINSFLQAAEDYSTHFLLSSLFRLLRYVCALSALVLPAFYVTVATFHHEMIPPVLAISIIQSKQGVPFPVYMEVLLMLIAFEVLLEAGLRLPKAIGQTVSIVGALVVGQAAVAANILSPGVVIVISTAGIAGFVIPSQDMSNAIRISRLILVILAAIGGMFTLMLGVIVMLYRLCELEPFGLPYLSPFVGNEGRQMLGDTIIRFAWFQKKRRPANIKPEDDIRAGG